MPLDPPVGKPPRGETTRVGEETGGENTPWGSYAGTFW